MTSWASSVDTAHTVDRDFLHQEFIGNERLCLGLICGGRRNRHVFAHEYLLSRGTGAIVTTPSATDQGYEPLQDTTEPVGYRT